LRASADEGPLISPQSIREGLLTNRWPAGWRWVSRSAHHVRRCPQPGGGRQLARHLSAHSGSGKITMVIGILDDKPYRSMCGCCCHGHPLIITMAKINRALPAEKSRQRLEGCSTFGSSRRRDALRCAVQLPHRDSLTLWPARSMWWGRPSRTRKGVRPARLMRIFSRLTNHSFHY